MIRGIEGTIGPRTFVAVTALALVGQYLISSEVLATGTLFGALALVMAYVLYPGRRA